MSRPNPWGENWHNENYSSAELDEILGRIFGPKCVFMGFMPAGKRKWVRLRSDGAMEVVKLHSDRGFVFYGGFGLSFPWIPHGDWKDVCWHKTPKSAVVDLLFEPESKLDWSISKSRTHAANQAQAVSAEICEACEKWFTRMSVQSELLNELERRRSKPGFCSYVQDLTTYLFWQARIGKASLLTDEYRPYLESYFGEDGYAKLSRLLDETVRASNPG